MLNFLYTAVSWVLLRWHSLLSFFGMNPDGGLTWALSIVLLVVTARMLLVRLFIKQVHHQRRMQEMQPRMQAIRKKYKADKAEMQRQMMTLQREEGFNPVAGCLPMFLQLPIFWGLYHSLRHLANSVALCSQTGSGQNLALLGTSDHAAAQRTILSLYSFSPAETCSAAQSRLFGGAPLAARLTDSTAKITQLGGTPGTTHIVVLLLVLISAGATFMTQVLVRRGQVTMPEGTAALIQKFMLFGVPLGTLGSGLFFPLGVLLYWFSSNTWTMGQQSYINKFHPHTEAEVNPDVGALGKTLAPKPGQRPVRPGKGATGATAKKPTVKNLAAKNPAANGTVTLTKSSADDASTPNRAGSGVPVSNSAHQLARASAASPGQRPNRPQGKRPAAKGPNKSKKRR